MTANIPFPALGLTRLRRGPIVVALLLASVVAGCAAPNGKSRFNDPYEKQNRENHAANIALDKSVIRPVSQVYGKAMPGPLRRGVTNLSNNFALPSYVINDLLQAKIYAAADNSLRFAVNTIFGIGGIFDPAGAMGLTAKRNDFGETLFVWGAPEGAYLELPVLGPSTERDVAGKVVDAVADPLRFVLPRDLRRLPLTTEVASKLNDRYRFSGTVDSLLYGSADSYAQMRLLYLEKRHFEIGQKSASANYNPYEDPYAK